MKYFGIFSILFGAMVALNPLAKGQTAEINISNVPIVHTTPGAKTTPITHQKYFIGERQQFGYNPRYTAAPVNFDQDNIPYIRVGVDPQGHDMSGEYTTLGVIQTLDDTGQWINLTSWLDAIKTQYPAWDRIYSAGTSLDEQVIFDSAGDAYTVVNTWYNSTMGWQSVLLYSKDKCRTWQVYPLGNSLFFIKLEMPEAWNDTGNPPVLLGSPYTFTGGPLYLIIPTKNSSGRLTMPAKVTLTSASDNVSAMAPEHSGMGNSTITKGNMIYVVYLQNAPSPDNTSGTPQYILAYDKVSKTITGPIFLGASDNSVPDTHDGPAITIDSQGYLHVLLGCHGGRFQYTKSLVPYSISGGWTPPVFIGNTGDYPQPEWTYIGLVCDKNDTLHVVGRYSGYGYCFGLWYMRKKAGQPWEENLGPLVMPFRAYYSCWYHKITMDHLGRLFVSYIYYGDQYDRGSPYTYEFDAYKAKWPWENPVLVDPVNTYYTGLNAHEPCVIMSDDGGDHWRLMLTTSLQVFFSNTFENGLDGWTLTNSPGTNPIRAVSSYTYTGHTITPRTGTCFARTEGSYSFRKASRTFSPARSGVFTGYLNMVENLYIGRIELSAGGHSFIISANSVPGMVSYSIDGTETATTIPDTTLIWHQIKFIATAAGVDGYWDGTLLFHSTLATSISLITFGGNEWFTAPCGYDDFSFVPAATVSGQVTLADFTGALSGVPVTFELRTPGLPTVVETDNATLDTLGNYSFVTGLTGPYDVTAKALNWLRQKQAAITLPANGTATVNFALANGDCDGNNAINSADISNILMAMDGVSGGLADIDGDGEVTSTDMAIILTNMDQVGD